MTVSTDVARVDYTGTGAQTVYPTTFRFLDEAHLRVILETVATGAEVVQVLNTDYTVSGAGDAAGGDVTMVVAPANETEHLIIKRDVPFTQLVDLLTNGPLPANTLEEIADQLTMAFQQVNERVDRSLHFKESSELTDIEMEDLVADKVLIVDSVAGGVEMGPTAGDIENAQTNAVAAATSATAAATSETNAAGSAAAAAAVQEQMVDAGGAADALTADFSPNIALVDNTRVFVRATLANATTTPTFNPDGLGANTIVKEGGATLVAGDIAIDLVMLLVYDNDNSQWELTNPVNPIIDEDAMTTDTPVQAPSQQSTKAYINEIYPGFVNRTSFGFGSTTTVTLGAAQYHHSGTVEQLLSWASLLTFTFGASGSNAGSANLGNNEFHYLYIDDSAVVTADTHVITNSELLNLTTAPTYSETKKGWYNGSDRCIGAFRTNGSAQIVSFNHVGDRFLYGEIFQDANFGSVVGTDWADQCTHTIPVFVNMVDAVARWFYIGASAILYTRASSASTTTGTIMGAVVSTSILNMCRGDIAVSTVDQKTEWRGDIGTNQNLTVSTNGWLFPKGM